jgi:putative salt-induced outer membrane protein
MHRARLALPVLAGVGLAIAGTAFGAEKPGWSGKGELGLVLARGNTVSETFHAKADVTFLGNAWKHAGGLSTLRSSARDPDSGEDETTGNRYELHAQSDYRFSPRSYTFAGVRYENDDFAPFEYQAVATLGYGHKVVDSEATQLSTEAGVGYRRSKERSTGDTMGDIIVFRGQLRYQQKLTATTKVFNTLLVENGDDNTFAQNDAGISVSISNTLALNVTYVVRHNTHVPPTVPPDRPSKKTDQLTTVNLVFAF